MNRVVGKVIRRSYSRIADEKWNSIVVHVNRKEEGGNMEEKKVLSDTTFVAKDNITSKGDYTRCGSKALIDYIGLYDATVIQLLLQKGLHLVGKTNMDEFGMGSANVHSLYGPVVNPLYQDADYVAGGSSGGSAAAVRAGLSTFGLGTDTGGSIRLPASHCGVIGFKPTYGRLSRWGVIPYAQSLDTVGIISENFPVLRKAFSVLDRHDPKDPTSLPNDIRSRIEHTAWKKQKFCIGVPEECLIEGLSSEVRHAWQKCLEIVQRLGHTVRLITIPSIRKLLLAYYTLATAEASSNLARYDGVRYGYKRKEGSISGQDFISSNRSDSLGEEVKRRILLGSYTLSSNSGNHYMKATEVRRKLVSEFNDVFNTPNYILNDQQEIKKDRCDFIICPTTIGKPTTIEQYLRIEEDNFLSSYCNDILTVPASLAGLPTISLPWCKGLDESSPPIGIQVISQFGYDDMLLHFSKSIFED